MLIGFVEPAAVRVEVWTKGLSVDVKIKTLA